MGVAVVDIGGGTTDLAIYVEGSVWGTLVREVGGNNITKDIAFVLRTPLATAEDAKVRYAHAVPSAVGQEEIIEIRTFGEENLTTISRQRLCQVVAARLEDVFERVAREVKRSGFDGLLPAGVVLTGGTANLMGIRDIAARVLQLPVRVGLPRRLHGLIETISNPAYATSVGLLLWGMREEAAVASGGSQAPGGGEWYRRVLEWLRVFLPR